MKSNITEESSIQTALIIGAGRVAWSLIPALQQAGVLIKGVLSRNYSESLRYLNAYSINIPEDRTNIPLVDAVFLTVADSAIESIANKFQNTLQSGQLLIHTSGSVGMDVLGNGGMTGVLYPMQAFTKEAVVPFRSPDVPVFVEGNTDQSQELILQLAQKLSGKVQVLSSEGRRRLHLGAVIASNFSNLMYKLTDELIPEVDFEVFESLIRNQVDLATKLGPAAAQTGPAIRGDEPTIAMHLELLRENPEIQEMYLSLSRLINPAISDPGAL